MRLLLHFTRKVFVVNLCASLLAALSLRSVQVVGLGQRLAIGSAVANVAAVGLTAGYAFATAMYFLFRRHELPLYYNHGIRIPACIGVAYAFHVVAFAPLLVVGLVYRAAG